MPDYLFRWILAVADLAETLALAGAGLVGLCLAGILAGRAARWVWRKRR